jgi:hypothetical protein
MHPDNPDVRPDDLRTGRVPAPVSANEFDQLDTTAPKSKP